MGKMVGRHFNRYIPLLNDCNDPAAFGPLDFAEDFLTLTREETFVGVRNNMSIVAGASELVSIHRLDAIEWVKKHTKDSGKEMYAMNFALREHHETVLHFVDRLRENGKILKIKQYDGTVALIEVLSPGSPAYDVPFMII